MALSLRERELTDSAFLSILSGLSQPQHFSIISLPGPSETPWNSYTAGRFPSLLNVMPKMLEADGEESSYWKANTSLREKIPGPQLPGEQRCSRLQLVYRVPRGRDKGEAISEGCLGFIF